MEDFQYVVERKKPAKICFGSGLVRDTNPIGKNLSPFQKRYMTENNPKIHPQTYDLQNFDVSNRLMNKVGSNQGVGGLANRSARFPLKISMQIPSPLRYDVIRKWGDVKESAAPFGSTTKRKSMMDSKTPGPGTYKLTTIKCRRTLFEYNFGRPTIVQPVPTFCVSKIVDKCDKCKFICEGDYWHLNFTNYLCQNCWEEERYFHMRYSEKQLKEFKKIRNCSFMHSHEGTTAAIRLHPFKKIIKQMRLENYLSLFINSCG